MAEARGRSFSSPHVANAGEQHSPDPDRAAAPSPTPMETGESLGPTPVPPLVPAPPPAPITEPAPSPLPPTIMAPSPASAANYWSTPPPDPLSDYHLSLNTRELRRGLSPKLARMENTLRNTAQLVEAHRQDLVLQHLRSALKAGQGEDSDYVLADHNLLWPRGRKHQVAAVLALVDGTYRHPGAARMAILIERKYHRPSLKKDALVLPCKCRRWKRAWSKQFLMTPA